MPLMPDTFADSERRLCATLPCPGKSSWHAVNDSCASAEGHTFGQRHRRRRSAVKSTQWGTGMDECLDEMQYDSTSVDDWGVNRDMQKAYRYSLLPAPALASGLAPVLPQTPMHTIAVAHTHDSSREEATGVSS